MVRKLRKRVSRMLDPLWRRVRPANLCVFHGGRVGSTVLGDLLGQHPRIHWGGEVYWQVTRQYKSHDGPEPFQPSIDHRGTLRSAMRKAGRCAFGGEVKFDHLDLMGIGIGDFVRADLNRMCFDHFVLMQRHNLLRQVASGLRVREEGRWKQAAGEEAVCRQVWIDVENQPYLGAPIGLLNMFTHIETRQEQVRQALKDRKLLCLHFEEDIERDPKVAYRRVCAFLGLESEATEIRLTRMNPFPLQEIIGNYDQVACALTGTRHEWMLERQTESSVAEVI